MGRVMVERGLVEPDPPDTPGPLAFGRRPGQIEELLDAAGFDDIEVEPLDFAMHAREPRRLVGPRDRARRGASRAWWRASSPAEHYKLRDAVDAAYAPYVRDDGSVEIPARALMAAAGA